MRRPGRPPLPGRLPLVVDLGAGAGDLLIHLLTTLPSSTGLALDLSAAACEEAERAARRGDVHDRFTVVNRAIESLVDDPEPVRGANVVHAGFVLHDVVGDTEVADGILRTCREARAERVPIEPFTDTDPTLGADDGYAIQCELTALLLADGDRVVGYKAGLTSGPMRAMFGVDSPDYGPVPASTLRADGVTVSCDAFIAPKVEAEIVFRRPDSNQELAQVARPTSRSRTRHACRTSTRRAPSWAGHVRRQGSAPRRRTASPSPDPSTSSTTSWTSRGTSTAPGWSTSRPTSPSSTRRCCACGARSVAARSSSSGAGVIDQMLKRVRTPSSHRR